MQYLSIEGTRTAYGADDIVNKVGTLTVGELIEVLRGYDEDLPVVLNNDDGYTYGEIKEWTIEEAEYVEE